MSNSLDRIRTAMAFVEHRPILPLVFLLALGIIFGQYFLGPWWIGLICATATLLLSGMLWLKTKKQPAFYFLVVSCFFFGTALMSRCEHPGFMANHISNFDETKLVLEGRVEGPILFYNDSVKCLVRSQKIILEHQAYMPVQGLVRLTIKQPFLPFGAGDVIRFEAKPRSIASYGTPGVFDRAKYFLRRSIAVEAYLRDAKKIELVKKDESFSFGGILERARHKIREHNSLHLPSPQNQIIDAIVLGEKERISKQMLDVFRKGGVAHLLSISGMHIGSIFVLVYLLCARLFRLSAWFCKQTNIFKISIVIALFPALFYAELAGWRISVTRSLLMVTVYAAAVLAGRQRDLLSALGAAAFITLVIWPYSLFEPAFQLSYSAVLAVTVIAPRILQIKKETSELDRLESQKRNQRWLQWLAISLASSVGATLITLPITIHHFGYVSLYAFISNLFMVPLFTLVVVPASLLGSMLLFASPSLASPFFYVATLAVDLGYAGTSLVSKLPESQIWLGRQLWFEIAAYFGLLGSLLYFRKRPSRLLAAVCAAVLILVPVGYHLMRQNRDNLKVTVIDVGQGLSQLVEFPGGKTWLIDGGGYPFSDFDVGKAVVGPFLRSKRIRTLDRVINTHPHPDHFVGLNHVLDAFKVKKITLSGLNWDQDDRYNRLLKKIEKMKIEQSAIGNAAHPELDIGNIRVQWLHPPGPNDEFETEISSWSLNDRSMVIKLTYTNCSILLPADIERKAERMLVEKGVNLRSDILVSPHHGSRTSSTPAFLTAVRPENVIIPVGRNNRYGLPSMPILKRYTENAIRIYRTDLHGTVEGTCDASGSNIVTAKNFKP